MKTKIIGTRGWIDRNIAIRSKTRVFALLSLVWFLVSPTPTGLLIRHQVAWFSAIGLFCWALVLLHPAFILLAFYFRLTEPQRIVHQRVPDTDYDLEHLD